MKKLILLAVCAAALFAAVPSSAVCVNNLPGNGHACAESWDQYEACVWGGAGSVYEDTCVDTNNNAPFDFYTYGYGDVHYYDVSLNNGLISTFLNVGAACAFVWAQPNLSNPGGASASTC